VLGEEPGTGGTTRYVDSSVERIQAKVSGWFSQRYSVTCNGFELPWQATPRNGEYIAGVRYRAWQPPSCLHPLIPVHTPLVFDIVDRALGRSLGGCRYHIDHPGGLNPGVYPINALEAESRRAARFFRMGHTGGAVTLNAISPIPIFHVHLISGVPEGCRSSVCSRDNVSAYNKVAAVGSQLREGRTPGLQGNRIRRRMPESDQPHLMRSRSTATSCRPQ
jgi:hypothetical protein